MRRWIAIASTLAISLAAAAPAWADSVRLPKDGAPAMVVDPPAGWTTVYDSGGNLEVYVPDHSASVTFSMISDAATAGTDPAELAATVMHSMGVKTISNALPGAIGGVQGETFVGKLQSGDVVRDL